MPKEPQDLTDQELARAAAQIIERLIAGGKHSSVLRAALRRVELEALRRGEAAKVA